MLSASLSFAQSARELMQQGQDAYNKKDYAKSAQLYRKAYDADHAQTVALYNAACSFALAGQKDDAFKALDELVRSGYNNPDFLNNDKDFASIKTDAKWSDIIARATENAKKNPPKPLWQKPYHLIDQTDDVATLTAKLGTSNYAVWLEGDVLTFLYKSAAKSVDLSGGIQEPMKQVPNSDLWILHLQMPGWEKAIVTYTFLESQGAVIPAGHLHVWSGAEAPAQPAKATELKGTIVERTYHSTALNEDRKLYIYLPPDAPKENLPAVFMADGEGCKGFAAVLEPLILSGKVRPCAIVGIANGGYRGDRSAGYDESKDFRAKEYVPGDDPDRFDRHLKFFTDEVGAYVAKEFGISTKREDKAVTGFSNGGAFAAAVAFRRPDFFGASIPLSLGIPPTDTPPVNLPHMFFAAGTLESFSRSTKQVYDLVHVTHPESTLDIYVAGHDPAMWDLAFATAMPKVFPAATD